MWIVCGKNGEIWGYALPVGVKDEDKELHKPYRRDCGDVGWGNGQPSTMYEINLTRELHSKFPYLDYDSEPIWVDFIDTSMDE